MSNRIATGMVTSSTLNDINSALSKLERSSEELSSGRTILQPSDNPYGASHAIDLQSQLDGLTSYTANVQDAISWTNTAGGAMSNMSSVVQRVRELLVQASNATYNQGDLNSVATEVSQLTETLKQDANTQYAGQYVFSGTLTTTPPYKQGPEDAYQGNAEAISRSIGPGGASVTVNTNISSLLGNGAGSGDGKLLETLRTISEHLTGGTAEDRAALNSTDLKAIDASMETLTQLQATAGSVTNQLHVASTRIEDLQSSIGKTLSNTQDADFAKTTMAYSNEQAAYQAALRAGANIVQESLLNFLH
ncbi:MAG TPA: flagellar hook-associated protein FlgL [Solirubrobacteraceae bacterium]|nr:flagellar hook-associated protein FlgL [Solirubrobacteraceae bacterium]